MYEDSAETIRKIEEDIRRSEQRGALLPQLQSAIDGVRARARSRQNDLSVEVDASGAVKDIEVSDAALDRGGRAVGQELMALVAKATQEARGRTLALTKEIMGDDPIVGVVAADLEAEDAGDHSWRFGGAR